MNVSKVNISATDVYIKDTACRNGITTYQEANTTASRAYSAGDLLIMDEQLYQVTDSISSGGTIVPGTNCEPVELSDLMADLRQDMTDLQTEVEAEMNTVHVLTGKNVVMIGDSFAAGTGAASGHGWPYYFAQVSGCNYNNAYLGINSGGGFVNPGSSTHRTFQQSIEYLRDHIEPADRAEVPLVIIAGGYNDYNYDTSLSDDDREQLEYQAVMNAIDAARGAFINAQVLCAPLYTDYMMFPQRYNMMRQVIRAAQIKGAITTFDLVDVLAGTNSKASSDNVHCNDTGYSILGGALYTLAQGGDILTDARLNDEITYNSNAVVVHYSVVTRHGRDVHIRCALELTGALTTSDILFNVSGASLPGYVNGDNLGSVTYIPAFYRSTHTSTAGMRSWQPIRIQTDGNATLADFYDPANGTRPYAAGDYIYIDTHYTSYSNNFIVTGDLNYLNDIKYATM